jgi:peptidoglycan/xylan/chitin deacetylase (PgdA/CDA1 family)
MTLYEYALKALRSDAVTTVARRLTKGQIRILAYHGVPDAEAFDAQMRYLRANFVPVGEGAIAAAINNGAELPPGAAWVTFDDGDPSVVHNGLPTLARLGIPATMFVCPGLIESREPFWWRITDWVAANAPDAVTTPGGPAALTEFVKTVSDFDRRVIIADIAPLVAQRPQSWEQLTHNDLARWLDAGLALGNHTWDHPCLDQCDHDAQVAQITEAHEWLCSYLGAPPRTFAYPNGNFSPVVDKAVNELGYDLGALYDNQLTRVDGPRLELSRLMVEADQPVSRLVGVLSGAQPSLAGLQSKLARSSN